MGNFYKNLRECEKMKERVSPTPHQKERKKGITEKDITVPNKRQRGERGREREM